MSFCGRDQQNMFSSFFEKGVGPSESFKTNFACISDLVKTLIMSALNFSLCCRGDERECGDKSKDVPTFLKKKTLHFTYGIT